MSILMGVIIAIIIALVGYVAFRPLIYTRRKCNGTKKLVGLKYSLINVLVAALWGTISRPLENVLAGIGGETGRALADISNIVLCGLWLYVSLGIMMKKTKAAVRKLEQTPKG